MASTWLHFTLFYLLTQFPPPSTQVSISLSWWLEGMSYFDNLITAHWDSVPPGTCCKPSPQQLPSLHNSRAGETIFHHLLQNQFGAGWAATGLAHRDIINCTGAPILRVFGPSRSTADNNDDDRIVVYNPPWGESSEDTPGNVVFAAAWVDLRVRFPPDSGGSRYLQWQGVKGAAVWGIGTWSAASDGVPFPKMMTKRSNRSSGGRMHETLLNGRALNGTAYVSGPVRWAVPDVYSVNGTEYRHVGNDTYMDESGSVLDFRRMVA